jgi:hypothetical protein
MRATMNEENAQPKYRAMLPRDTVPIPFAQAMAVLGLSLNGARHLLGDRVTRGAVKHWKKGRRAVPIWATEVLNARLQDDIALRQQSLITPVPKPVNTSLNRWRRERALAKEKARD